MILPIYIQSGALSFTFSFHSFLLSFRFQVKNLTLLRPSFRSFNQHVCHLDRFYTSPLLFLSLSLFLFLFLFFFPSLLNYKFQMINPNPLTTLLYRKYDLSDQDLHESRYQFLFLDCKMKLGYTLENSKPDIARCLWFDKKSIIVIITFRSSFVYSFTLAYSLIHSLTYTCSYFPDLLIPYIFHRLHQTIHHQNKHKISQTI